MEDLLTQYSDIKLLVEIFVAQIAHTLSSFRVVSLINLYNFSGF